MYLYIYTEREGKKEKRIKDIERGRKNRYYHYYKYTLLKYQCILEHYMRLEDIQWQHQQCILKYQRNQWHMNMNLPSLSNLEQYKESLYSLELLH